MRHQVGGTFSAWVLHLTQLEMLPSPLICPLSLWVGFHLKMPLPG